MVIRSASLYLVLGLASAIWSLRANAHEYWLDPIDSTITGGESVIVDVRNGQNYSGTAFPYSKSFKSVSISSNNQTTPYTGRLGDYPAIHPQLDKVGIYAINLESTASKLTYETWEKFETFLNYHGLNNIAAQHTNRDLPRSDITERYYRSAKTLVQASNTGEHNLTSMPEKNLGEHQAFNSTGAHFELVMLDNPYSDINQFRVKLLLKGEVFPHRQVELFWQGDQLIRLTTNTDKQGIASFEMQGQGDYLLNAVHVTTPDTNDVHWQSHWASFTFER